MVGITKICQPTGIRGKEIIPVIEDVIPVGIVERNETMYRRRRRHRRIDLVLAGVEDTITIDCRRRRRRRIIGIIIRHRRRRRRHIERVLKIIIIQTNRLLKIVTLIGAAFKPNSNIGRRRRLITKRHRPMPFEYHRRRRRRRRIIVRRTNNADPIMILEID